MKAYYLVFALTLLISLFYNARTDVGWKRKLFWTFLPLFVFGAIRVDFGNDYKTYESLFELYHSEGLFYFDYDAHSEIGYQLLNRIFPSFRLLLIFSSFLLSFSLAVFSYHNIPKQYLWLAVILLFLNPEKNIYGTLVAMRSGLCVSCFLLCFVLVQRRQWIPFFIITFVLSFIHTSVLLFLPIAYLVSVNKPFSTKEMWFWIGGSAVILFASMSQLFNIISSLISNDMFERYEEVLSESSLHRGFLQVVTCLIFMIFFVVYLQKRSRGITQKENSVIRMGLLFAVSLLLGSLSMRASYFYDVFFIAAVIKIYSDKKASETLRYGLLFLAIVSSYYSMFRVWMGSPWWDHAVYHSLLGNW